MEAIQEITSDLEDLHKNINDQATNERAPGILSTEKARVFSDAKARNPRE